MVASHAEPLAVPCRPLTATTATTESTPITRIATSSSTSVKPRSSICRSHRPCMAPLLDLYLVVHAVHRRDLSDCHEGHHRTDDQQDRGLEHVSEALEAVLQLT